MRSALESGQLRMQDLISELNIKILIPAMDQPDMLSNWNQPEDAAAVRVKVLLFASLRDRLGFSEREMIATDTDSLRAWLESQLPEAAQLPYRIAVNEDLVADNQKLQNGDVVALMPPFAGG
jgi:molybdopterin synthase sulfur carrier subunit